MIKKENKSGTAEVPEPGELKNKFTELKSSLIKNYFLSNRYVKVVPVRNFIQELERELLINALKISNGNQRIASDLLGVKPTTLNEKLKKLKIGKNKIKKDFRDLIDDVSINLL